MNALSTIMSPIVVLVFTCMIIDYDDIVLPSSTHNDRESDDEVSDDDMYNNDKVSADDMFDKFDYNNHDDNILPLAGTTYSLDYDSGDNEDNNNNNNHTDTYREHEYYVDGEDDEVHLKNADTICDDINNNLQSDDSNYKGTKQHVQLQR